MFEACGNARTLAAATREDGPLEAALARWSDARADLDERMAKTGHALEDVMIRNTIDLVASGVEAVGRRWRESVDFPAEYSYLKSA